MKGSNSLGRRRGANFTQFFLFVVVSFCCSSIVFKSKFRNREFGDVPYAHRLLWESECTGFWDFVACSAHHHPLV